VVDFAGDVALEAADDFFVGLALGEPSDYVVLGVRIPAESTDGDDVERRVGVAVQRGQIRSSPRGQDQAAELTPGLQFAAGTGTGCASSILKAPV
jgi:hypothetical protein